MILCLTAGLPPLVRNKKCPSPHLIPLTICQLAQPGITRQWAWPNSRQAVSHQLKKRGSQDVRDILTKERVSDHDFMNDPWRPVRDHGPKIPWVMFLRFSLFQNPASACRDVTRSQRIFETTVEHVKSLFPRDMDCFKVNQIFGDEVYRLKIHSWRFGRYQTIIT